MVVRVVIVMFAGWIVLSLPHSPGNLVTLTEQMRNAMMEANMTVQASEASAMPNVPGNGNAAELMPPVG